MTILVSGTIRQAPCVTLLAVLGQQLAHFKSWQPVLWVVPQLSICPVGSCPGALE